MVRSFGLAAPPCPGRPSKGSRPSAPDIQSCTRPVKARRHHAQRGCEQPYVVPAFDPRLSNRPGATPEAHCASSMAEMAEPAPRDQRLGRHKDGVIRVQPGRAAWPGDQEALGSRAGCLASRHVTIRRNPIAAAASTPRCGATHPAMGIDLRSRRVSALLPNASARQAGCRRLACIRCRSRRRGGRWSRSGPAAVAAGGRVTGA